MVVFLSLHQKKLYAKMMERLDYRLIHDHDVSCLFCHFISSIIFHPGGGNLSTQTNNIPRLLIWQLIFSIKLRGDNKVCNCWFFCNDYHFVIIVATIQVLYTRDHICYCYLNLINATFDVF